MPRFFLPGPAEVEVEVGTRLQDVSGPPIEVSSRVAPDPVAIYCLTLALRDCTAAIERSTAAGDRRHRRWLIIAALFLLLLAAADVIGTVVAPRWQDDIVMAGGGAAAGWLVAQPINRALERWRRRLEKKHQRDDAH